MRYQGGKGRIAVHLAPVILARAAGRRIVEPFHGGLQITRRILPAEASDASRPLSTLISAVRAGWNPPESLSEDEYQRLAERKAEVDDPLVCFAGQCCTFGGKWFGGYARPHKSNPDPIGGSRLSFLNRIEATRAVAFRCCHYADATIRPGDVVYCDPPYRGTSHDYPVEPFDHGAFWQWARDVSRTGAIVLVSEFTAPEDVAEVWRLDRATVTRKADGSRVVERLFEVRL